MSYVNPGPASATSSNSVAAMTPVNTQNDSNPQEQGQLRLLGVARAVNLASAGDPAVIRIRNSSAWSPSVVITTNALISGATGDIHTATVGLYPAASAGGTAVLTTAALTGQVSSTFVYNRAATTTNAIYTQQSIYVHVGTPLANATTDVYLYGYDLSQ